MAATLRSRSGAVVAGVLTFLVVALGGSAAVAAVAEDRVDESRTELATKAAVVATGLRSALARTFAQVESVGGIFRSAPVVTPESFARFGSALDLTEAAPTMAVALRVARSELPAHESRLEQWYPGVELFELSGGRRAPLGSRPEYHIVEYQVGLPGSFTPIGFDLGSEPTRLAAVEEAESTGETVLTGFTELLSTGEPDGFLVVAPVRDISGRIIGVSAAGASVAALLEASVAPSLLEEVAVSVRDVTHRSSLPAGVAPFEVGVHRQVLDVGDRLWELDVAPAPGTAPLDPGRYALGLLAVLGVAGGSGWTVATFGTRRARERDLELAAERAEARERLVEALAGFRLLAESSTDLISRHAADGTFLYASPAARSVLGADPEDLVGRNILDVVHPDDVALVADTRERLVVAPGSARVTLRVRRTDGGYTWVETTLRSVEGPGGSVEFHCATRDVSDLVRQAEELREARDVAERADEEKSRFLSTVSHDIRTPMTAIIGLSDILAEGSLDAEAREYVAAIRSSAGALVSLVNDLLDSAKLSSGKMTAERAPVRIAELLADIHRLLAVEAERKGVRVELSVDPGLPPVVLTDSSLLRRILSNLIGNAVKFTDEGAVTVSARLDDADGSVGHLRVSVRDTGIGIPADRIEAVFDDFTQSDGSTAARFGGTGLGLGIARGLARLMGGDLWLESEPGAGSTFTFTVEVGLDGTTPDVAGLCRVVGADEAAVGRVVDLLAGAGIAVSPDGRLPVVVVGPDLDGADVAGAVVVDRTPGRGRAAAVEARGALGYAGEPVRADDLADLVRAAERGESGFLTVHAVRAERPVLRVLVADDAPTNRLLFTRILEGRGHRVRAVADGEEAVAVLLDPEERPDVALLDLAMPRLDGLAVARLIRSRPELSGVAVVALTGRAGADDRAEALAAGFDVVLVKPVGARELAEAVEGAVAPPPVAEADAVLDRAVLDSDLGPELAGDIYREALAEVLDELNGLRLAIAARDVAALQRSAHRLKGTLGIVGAGPASAAAATAEGAAKAGDDEGALAASGRLVDALQLLVPELRRAAPV